jgi:hypothetical protein
MEYLSQSEPLLQLISEIEKELLLSEVIMDETDISNTLSNIKQIIEKFKQQYKDGKHSKK